MKTLNNKKRISMLLIAAMLISIVAGIFASNGKPTFTDVPSSHWSYSYVERAAENGWVNGIGNNKFAPNDTLTFSQFYTMIVPVFVPNELAAYQAPSGSPWWQPYMSVGAEYLRSHAITLDTMYVGPADMRPDPDETLQKSVNQHANEPISRSDAISIMWRVLEKNGLDKKVPGVEEAKEKVESINGVLPLLDETSVPICYAAGLVTGNERGELNLQSSLTRAEGCVMLCNLVDYVTKNGGNATTKPQEPGTDKPETPDPSNPSGTGLGQKLSSGATAAAGVLSSIGKDDAYPTYGNSDVVSPNGYFTGATDVDIGNAKLQYEFLDLVNEVRVAEGHEPLTWVSSDAAEEHTLQRCNELVTAFTHERPKGKFANETIARGQASVNVVFNDWMNSPIHKDILMSDSCKYLSAARTGNCWIICVWRDFAKAEKYSIDNYDYSSYLS